MCVILNKLWVWVRIFIVIQRKWKIKTIVSHFFHCCNMHLVFTVVSSSTSDAGQTIGLKKWSVPQRILSWIFFACTNHLQYMNFPFLLCTRYWKSLFVAHVISFSVPISYQRATCKLFPFNVNFNIW